MSCTLNKEELDEQFELFLKEPISDDDSVNSGSSEKKPGTKLNHTFAQKQTASWRKDEEDSRQGARGGVRAEPVPQPRSRTLKKTPDNTPAASTDSLKGQSNDDSKVSAANTTNVGLDTLEEEEEKARFFAELEAEASSTLDYSKLNRELECTTSTIGTSLRKSEEGEEQRVKNQRITESFTECSGSPQYSKNLEEDHNQNGLLTLKEKFELPQMLNKVSLYDSLDDTTGEDRMKTAGTMDRDLPTAEELMKPIWTEDYIRGFSPQLSSDVEFGVDQKKTSDILENTFRVETSSELQLKSPEETGPGLEEGGNHPPIHNLTWNIGEEVDRLMQDHKTYSSSTSSLAPKSNKQLASNGTILSHAPSTSSVKKPAGASVRVRRVAGRTAVTSRTSGLNRAVASQRTQTSVPRLQRQSQSNLSKSAEKHDTESGVNMSNELDKSAQSLVTVFQQQMRLSSHPSAANTEHDLLPHCLPKHKLRSSEKVSKITRCAESTVSSQEERLQQMDKEIKEQETLIKGYQQENEKLYLQLKTLQIQSKVIEETMFNENQKLLSELAFSREQLNKTSKSLCNVYLKDHTQRVSDLLDQINIFQRNEAQLYEDMNRLKQENEVLVADLQLMRKERAIVKAPAASETEDKHREEMAVMKKRLQGFAENQEQLDRDDARVKAATDEIQQLKEQVEKPKMIAIGRKAKEKTVDSKMIEELERQVNEPEQILRNRSLNSSPAAATADRQGDVATEKTPPPSRINILLERKIQRLEAELEKQNEEAKCCLRTMEHEFHLVKLCYEQQISELHLQLEQKRQQEAADSPAEVEPHTAQLHSLEKELQNLKQTHKEREKSLQEVIESLQQQRKFKGPSRSGCHHCKSEAAFGIRIERLNQQLSNKTQTIQELRRTVERLQKEKRNMLTIPTSQSKAETQTTETARPTGAAKTHCATCAAREMFPAAQYEKTYQPMIFTDSHISEVLQENEALKQRLERVELHIEKENEALKADATRAREELDRLQVNSAEQLSSLKAEHLQVIEQLQAAHALEHSSSKVAELANKLNTQEITVKVLQEQLKELQEAKHALEISRTRENALEQQLSRLLSELKEVKEAQSPEVKLLCSLETKLINMEFRHTNREKELQQVIARSWQMSDSHLQSQVDHWKRLAQDKNRELETFRQELDSILDILRHLHRQGVVLPLPAPISHRSEPTHADTLKVLDI